MIEIYVAPQLKKEIEKKFGIKKTLELISFFETLKENPKKGKKVGKVGPILIKELKYETFRFYFILNGYELQLVSSGELNTLLIKFIKMSKKTNQQEIIEEIKKILIKLGF